VGRTLDIKAEELYQMEEMENLVKILQKYKEEEENPRSGCSNVEEVGHRRWDREVVRSVHMSARTRIRVGDGGRG